MSSSCFLLTGSDSDQNTSGLDPTEPLLTESLELKTEKIMTPSMHFTSKHPIRVLQPPAEVLKVLDGGQNQEGLTQIWAGTTEGFRWAQLILDLIRTSTSLMTSSWTLCSGSQRFLNTFSVLIRTETRFRPEGFWILAQDQPGFRTDHRATDGQTPGGVTTKQEVT